MNLKEYKTFSQWFNSLNLEEKVDLYNIQRIKEQFKPRIKILDTSDNNIDIVEIFKNR